MGYYVNPREGTKEEWLQRHGRPVTIAGVRAWDFDSDYLPVCWVQNPGFTAAVIIGDPGERDRILRSKDRRPKRWYSVAKHRLREFMHE